NLLYMSSSSDASGLATVTLYFLPGTNPDTAQVQVQNKLQLATPSLPQTVQQQGVVVAKATRNFMMFLTLSTVDDSLDEVALGNYIASSVLDPIRRVSGVGEANMFGSQYAARVALGAENYRTRARVNWHLSAAVAIKLSPSANALNTAEAVRKKVTELSKFFPPGVRVDYPLDTSTFVQISIEEVLKTLIEAVALVFLVMYVFLQNIRATLIPTIVVPVALLATFVSMLAFGSCINVCALFGMVLSIGILVDDAIVVVENVERIMAEEGLSPL